MMEGKGGDEGRRKGTDERRAKGKTHAVDEGVLVGGLHGEPAVLPQLAHRPKHVHRPVAVELPVRDGRLPGTVHTGEWDHSNRRERGMIGRHKARENVLKWSTSLATEGCSS